MAGFHTKTFMIDDDYMTPKNAWENIQHLIPKDKIIWEAFYGDGKSGEILKSLGFEVIHKPVNFYDNDLGDIIISNPPFSDAKKILLRLKELDKPFILIMPSSKICTSYIRDFFEKKKLQIIIPRKRIHFLKNNSETNKCNFDCFYYCYKMNLEKDIFWLN